MAVSHHIMSDVLVCLGTIVGTVGLLAMSGAVMDVVDRLLRWRGR